MVADGSEPPVDKPCGEGLMPETQELLRKLGVGLSAEDGFGFRGICFQGDGAKAEAEFPERMGLGIRRTILHERMIAAAEQAGARLLWKTSVAGISDKGVQLRDGFVESRWIIGADGSGSRVRKWRGLDAAKQKAVRFATRRHYRVAPWTDFMEIYWGAGRQAYVTPTNREEVCVVVMASQARKADFDECLREMPDLAARLRGAKILERERGAITQMHRLRRVTAGNVAMIGDASGSVDAITGQGLWLSFRQAFALAAAMERGDLRSYEREHRAIARRPAFMAELLLALGKRSAVRRRLLRGFAEHPEMFGRLLALHCRKAKPAEWAMAGAVLGWRMLTA